MIPKKERDKVFDSLVENGIDFLASSVADLDARPKYSVVHFATGLELLLKARLFAEHWALVAANPHAATWSGLTSGTLKTVSASSIGKALIAVVSEPSSPQCKVFESVFRHRNRILHFMPVEDPAAIAMEQLRAWFHLHSLIQGRWESVFAGHRGELAKLDQLLRRNRNYLQTIYDQTEARLSGLKVAGKVLECRSCGFSSGELDSPTRLVSGVACHVCGDRYAVIRFDCGNAYPLDGATFEFDCDCGVLHKVQDLISKYDESRDLSPKDQLIHGPGRYRCGECLSIEETVVPIDGAYTCLGCGAEWGDEGPESCEWCNELWFGYSLEGSYLNGCELCEGKIEWDSD